MKRYFILLGALIPFLMLLAQSENSYIHRQSDGYEWPTDPKVLEKLDKWQDLKFGVLFHWGLYSVPGICESWPLCSEDWVTRPDGFTYQEYKDWYWGFADTFNPTEFNPSQWAEIMEKAGMKYMVFTTKHHDGFNMFDTKYSDFSIAKGPFGDNPMHDVALHVFDAFRDKDFMIGAYFSKPDWHCEWFWNPGYATPNRMPNYKRNLHPDWWKNYQDFTQNQLTEIVDNYGPLDILWLDGGWIEGEEVGLDNVLAHARSTSQPGLISVDRTIKGRNENYQTPERTIPDHQLSHPWESCLPLSQDWGWTPEANFKTPYEVVCNLIEVTAKGGSLLLGVGPTPQGIISPEVESILHEIGKWLEKNGEAIYNTRPTPHYNADKIWFTASKDGETIYAICTEPSQTSVSAIWEGNIPEGPIVNLSDKKKIPYSVKNGKVTVKLPKSKDGMPVAMKFKVSNKALTNPPYKDATLPVETRIDDLLGRMTLGEKIGQLSCPMGWEMYEKHGNSADVSPSFRSLMEKNPVGALWGVLRADPWTKKTLETGLDPELAAMAVNAIQKYAVDSTRLGIPLLIAEECPHGHMAIGTTVFPTSLAQGATWNTSLIQDMGEAIAAEAASQGANIGFGPVLDVCRDPRWSRMEESYGEDPFLCAEIGSAMMRGMQGSGDIDRKHLYSTLKHFAAYGSPEGGHNGGAANMGYRKLLNEYLPPFKKCIDDGAMCIMTSYNEIDGIPSTANQDLLTGLLRDTWGFPGIVWSDLFSIEGIMTMNAAADRKEAASKALKAGVDIDLGGQAYRGEIEKALKEGRITQEEIDNAVANVLRAKFQLGLFENPYVSPDEAKACARNLNHKALAHRVAAEGTVLLKNDGILPLPQSISSIAIIGPNADSPYNQLGDYTAPQDRKEIATVLDGIKNSFPEASVTYVKGCAIRDTISHDIDDAVKAAQNADVAIVVVGGSSARDFKTSYIETGAATVSSDSTFSDMDCGEGYDRATLTLLGKQEELLKGILNTGTPVVVIYIEGRPLDMNTAVNANALLAAFYPGEQGGMAIADIISGKVNPSGHLPVSIPRHVGQVPLYYSQHIPSAYMDIDSTPLFPFGFGLSYTDFEYSDLGIEKDTENKNTFNISFTITNTGDYDGAEVAQLYLTQKNSSISRPPLLLKSFEKVFISKGESKRVTLTLAPEQLGIYDSKMQWKVEPGIYEIQV